MDLSSLAPVLSHGGQAQSWPPSPFGVGREEEGSLSHCPPAVPAVLPAHSVPLAMDVLVLPMSPVSLVEQGKMDGSWG